MCPGPALTPTITPSTLTQVENLGIPVSVWQRENKRYRATRTCNLPKFTPFRNQTPPIGTTPISWNNTAVHASSTQRIATATPPPPKGRTSRSSVVAVASRPSLPRAPPAPRAPPRNGSGRSRKWGGVVRDPDPDSRPVHVARQDRLPCVLSSHEANHRHTHARENGGISLEGICVCETR